MIGGRQVARLTSGMDCVPAYNLGRKLILLPGNLKGLLKKPDGFWCFSQSWRHGDERSKRCLGDRIATRGLTCR